jgi:uncharacterized YigZ family protein
VTALGYRVPATVAEAEIREKGSRFLAVVTPAADETAAKKILAELRQRHPDATHHCWAWRLGRPPQERSSDAGEPAGTAGVPILQVLRGAELSDVLAVVVRWFGGTKLGKGGLARAYAGATREAVAALKVARRVPTVRRWLELPYDRLGAVKRLVHPPAVELVDESYGDEVRLELRIQSDRLEEVEAALADLGLETCGADRE